MAYNMAIYKNSIKMAHAGSLFLHPTRADLALVKVVACAKNSLVAVNTSAKSSLDFIFA